MLKNITYFLLFSVLSMLILTTPVLASDANTALADANKVLSKTVNLVKSGEIDVAKETYSTYSKAWVNYEDTIKTQSKQAYGDIEEKMGMVQQCHLVNQLVTNRIIVN